MYSSDLFLIVPSGESCKLISPVFSTWWFIKELLLFTLHVIIIIFQMLKKKRTSTSPPLLGHWLILWLCQWRPFASAMAGLCQKSYLTNCWKHVRWCVPLEMRYASLHLVKPHLFLSKPSHLCCRHCQKAYILSLWPSNSINYEFHPRSYSHAFFFLSLRFVCLFTSVLSSWCLWIIFFKRNVN